MISFCVAIAVLGSKTQAYALPHCVQPTHEVVCEFMVQPSGQAFAACIDIEDKTILYVGPAFPIQET
jgi:hypothetical protein